MDDIQQLEERLKSEKYKKSIFNVMKDTLGIGLEEFSKTVSFIFSSPSEGKGQISTDIDKWEDEVIKDRFNS